MMRKYLFSIALSLLALMAQAQPVAGQWKIHPYFVAGRVSNCIDAHSKVYYLAGSSLYCYDKATQVSQSLDINGVLNNNSVQQIYYNVDKKFLVVAYTDCNIDIILDDGKVVNVPAIKDVILNKAKVINDVTFCPGRIYVATSFGYVVIDDTSFNILETRNYGANVKSVAVMGGTKVMSLFQEFYYSGMDEAVETDRWHSHVANTIGSDGRIFPITDNKFFFSTTSALYIVNIVRSTGDDGKQVCTFTAQQAVDAPPAALQRTPQGFVASFIWKGYCYTFDSNGDNPQRINGSYLFSSQEGPGNWWVLGTQGLAHLVNGTRSDYIVPNGISITQRAYWTTYDPTQQRILLSRTAENRVLELYIANTVTEINSYDGNQWRNITPVQNDPYGGNYWIVVSPNEPNTYFYCSRKTGGVAKVQNDQVVARYNMDNSPVCERAVSLRFDSRGNLWMPQTRDMTGHADVVAISAQNQLNNSPQPSHFVVNDMNGACYAEGFKRTVFDIGKGDVKVFSAGDYDKPLIFWTNNEDLSLKRYKVMKSFVDQNNRDFTTYAWVYLKTDNDSLMWVGTASGVIAMDPSKAFDTDFRINRIQVNINEGSPASGALLEGTQVNCIDVDAQNRKWLATNTSGIYFVSPDGSEIYKHFDTSNSPLPSDQVYSVCCNRATGSVLVVTANGVVEYFGDKTAAAADFSKVYAYPNPVAPDFTGYVTITGLMENSIVVITDVKGNPVAKMTSTGGVAIWDGCNSSGNRQPTGTYKVYAAQGTTPATTGTPLTRIVMIK